MSIRIIEEAPLEMTQVEYERLSREWRENCKYMVAPPSFETWARSRLKPRQLVGPPVIDPSLMEAGK